MTPPSTSGLESFRSRLRSTGLCHHQGCEMELRCLRALSGLFASNGGRAGRGLAVPDDYDPHASDKTTPRVPVSISARRGHLRAVQISRPRVKSGSLRNLGVSLRLVQFAQVEDQIQVAG